MRNTIASFLLLLQVTLSAQPDYRFADSTAQWNVLEAGNPMWCMCYNYTTQTYTAAYDTFFHNRYYQKIEPDYFVRRDSTGKVFKRSVADTLERLMYDFSKSKGDTFSIDNYPSLGWSIFCQVDSVDTVFIGKPRKRLYITYNNDPWKPDQWLEGIGSINSHFLQPGLDHTMFDGPSWTLLCYSENQQTLIHDTTFSSCMVDTVIWLGINEKLADNFKVTYQPAPPMLSIYGYTIFSVPLSLQLQDITGRLIFEKPLDESSTQVSLSDVNKGIYIYTITDGNQKLAAGKLVR